MEANETRRVMVLEDCLMVRRVIAEEIALWAGGRGIEVVEDATGEALRTYRSGRFSLLVLDGDIPGIRPLGFLRNLRKRGDELPTIVMSCGAPRKNGSPPLPGVHVLRKPFGFTEMKRALAMALPSWAKAERVGEEERGSDPFSSWRIEGRDPGFLSAVGTAWRAARSDATVLILGESGTGKELVARATHAWSPRAAGPFVAVNVAALAETLLESELFGHEKGAFTGADARRPGKLEIADGGTIFLDEIGDMSPALQVKLLRFLEERAFQRVGGTETVTLDVRVIAATHRDLPKLVSEGRFRADLYWRLHVVAISLPVLSQRREDIPRLVRALVERSAERHHRRPLKVAPALMKALENRPWPGNVRELENTLECMVVLAEGEVLDLDDMPPEAMGPDGAGAAAARANGSLTPEQVLQALKWAAGNRTEAAEILGISRRWLQKLIVKYRMVHG